MGLEAINFFFRSEEEIEHKLTSNKDIIHCQGKRYVYKKDGDFWIDMEVQDFYSLSLRIALCNPRESVLRALHHLLSFLYSFKGAVLKDMRIKQVYNLYDDEVKQALEESYLNRKKIFESMYGSYTAAIGSEEFYKRQGEIETKNE